MNFITLQDSFHSLINLENVQFINKFYRNNSYWNGKKWVDYYYLKIDEKEVKYGNNEKRRDEDYERLINLLQPIRRFSMLQNIKNYLSKHQDTLITLAIVILLDEFLFGGSFRDRIKKTVESLLNRTQKKLEE